MELVQCERQLKAKTLLIKISSQNKNWPPKTLSVPAGNKIDFFPYSFYFNVGRFCLAQILEIAHNFKHWTCYQVLNRFKCPMTICP